jgi:hypothetical protein
VSPAGPEPTTATFSARRAAGTAVRRSVLALPVGHEALEAADRDRLLPLAEDAVQLALVLDRADAAADRRQQVPPPDRLRGLVEAAQRDRADEVADRHVDGATLLAEQLLALQAPPRLDDGLLDR